MKAAGLSFNLMTLGGIAAAIGLVIDDAIVVVEAIYAKIMSRPAPPGGRPSRIGEIFMPLVGSTLTPVVVFIPLAFLDGITGVFFRALAMTMVVALLTSLVLAITLTPSLAALVSSRPGTREPGMRRRTHEGGFLLHRVLRVYEVGCAHGACAIAGSRSRRAQWCFRCGIGIYQRLESDFLPAMDEGGFVIDYVAPPGTSLAETDRPAPDRRKDHHRAPGYRKLLPPHGRCPGL